MRINSNKAYKSHSGETSLVLVNLNFFGTTLLYSILYCFYVKGCTYLMYTLAEFRGEYTLVITTIRPQMYLSPPKVPLASIMISSSSSKTTLRKICPLGKL